MGMSEKGRQADRAELTHYSRQDQPLRAGYRRCDAVAKSRTAPVYAALTSSFRDPQTPIRGVVDEVSLDLIAVNHRDPGTKRQISRIAKNRRFGSLRNRNEEFFPQLLQPVHRQWTATQTTQAEACATQPRRTCGVAARGNPGWRLPQISCEKCELNLSWI